MMKLLVVLTVAWTLLFAAPAALAVSNQEWLANSVSNPTSTVESALITIRDNPACPPDVLLLCDYWLSWSGDDVATALTKVQGAWDAYHAVPTPDWQRLKDCLDEPGG